MPPVAEASPADEVAGPVRRRLGVSAARIGQYWPGRIALEIGADFYRMQIFDRAMTVAAQIFTSIFPVLIMLAALLGHRRTVRIADLAGVPDNSLKAIDAAMGTTGANTFGVVGSVVVLVSATSLARALVRAYAIIWQPARLPGRLTGSWRWLLVVLLLVVFLVGTRLVGHLTDGLPYPDLFEAATSFGLDVALTIMIPWLLLSRAIPVRMLVPGAVVFALSMLVVRPAGAIYLPRALDTSERRYGPIGLAFTYLGWLYVLAFTLLAAVVAGHVLATDRGVLGRWIRGTTTRSATAVPTPVAPVAAAPTTPTTPVRPGPRAGPKRTGIGRRLRLFHDTEERTAAAIYGIIVSAAVLATSHADSAIPIMAAVLATLIIYWTAERYARVVAERIHEGHRPSWDRVLVHLTTGWEIVTASMLPVLVLGTVRLLGFGLTTAVISALLCCTVLLGMEGWAIGRNGRLAFWERVSSSVAVSLFGVLMILLKAALH